MKDIVVDGAEHSSVSRAAEATARKAGYALIPDPMPEGVSFIRSDQYSFVLQGVPAVFVFDGATSTDPGVDGLAVAKKWLVTRYHTPLDNMDQPLNYASAARAAGFDFLMGYELAARDDSPVWNPGDFFGTKFESRHLGSGQ
jgi:Zn-dependent M28 family amino/carboxypeptidase